MRRTGGDSYRNNRHCALQYDYVWNPLQNVDQAASGMHGEDRRGLLLSSARLPTRLLAFEIGRASIDLYPGRLVLSDDDIRAARERDMEPSLCNLIAFEPAQKASACAILRTSLAMQAV